MSKPKFLTPKFIECAIRYVVYFLAVAITPLLAKPISPFFDWAGYGLMRPLFVEVFTIIFWGIEWVIIFFIERKRKAKKTTVEEQREKENVLEEKVGKAVKVRVPYSLKVRPPLPLKNVFILTAISIVCIFIISAVTGFKVKPIYDIGEKVTGYEMYNKIGWLGRNVFKCFWILGAVKACRGMAEEVVNTSLPADKAWLRWVIQLGVFMIFGLFDVFTAVMVYPLTTTRLLVGLTYILFYIMFVPVQALTEGSDTKAFLLIVLIYLF